MPTKKKTMSKNAKSKQAVSPATPEATTPVITTAITDANSKAREAVELSYQTLCTGLQSNYPPDFVFTIDGNQQPTSVLVGTFQRRIAAAEATKAAKDAYHEAVAAERAADQEARPMRAGLETFFQAQLGKTNPKLKIYGFVPRKVTVLTPAEKAEAAAKGSATKAAGGKKAKKKAPPATPTPAQ
jgi:hypothetical protein